MGIAIFKLFEDYEKNVTEKELIYFRTRLYFKLTNSGYDCVLFTNGLLADYEAILKLKEHIGLKNEQIMPRPENVEELTKIIGNLDGAIVTRLHASIIAYSYKIPTVGLIWNDTQSMFGTSIGHSERFVEWPFNEDELIDLLENALKVNEEIDYEYCNST